MAQEELVQVGLKSDLKILKSDSERQRDIDVFAAEVVITNNSDKNVLFKAATQRKQPGQSRPICTVRPKMGIVRAFSSSELKVFIHGREKGKFKIMAGKPPYEDLERLKISLNDLNDAWIFMSGSAGQRETVFAFETTVADCPKLRLAEDESSRKETAESSVSSRTRSASRRKSSPSRVELLEAAMDLIEEKESKILSLKSKVDRGPVVEASEIHVDTQQLGQQKSHVDELIEKLRENSLQFMLFGFTMVVFLFVLWIK